MNVVESLRKFLAMAHDAIKIAGLPQRILFWASRSHSFRGANFNLAHHSRKPIGIGRRDEQMQMRGHQAVGKEQELSMDSGFGERLQDDCKFGMRKRKRLGSEMSGDEKYPARFEESAESRHAKV